MSTDHETEGTPTFEDVLLISARRAIAQGDGPMFAEVLSYDSERQRAVVKPLFHVWRGDRFQRIPGFEVDVAWPRSGSGFAITLPLAQGVIVQLLPQTVDSSPHQSGSQDVAPPTKRRNQLSDAVAQPLGTQPAQPLPAAAVADDGIVIYATPFIYLGGSTATDFVALAQKVLTELAAAKADRDAMKAIFDVHYHGETGAITSTPLSGPPPGVPVTFPNNTPPNSVASAVVKSL